MHIRTFRAANLQAALSDIRRQMGPSASVLHTRQVRDGWLGWLGRTQVEVTAGLHDESASSRISAAAMPPGGEVGDSNLLESHQRLPNEASAGRIDARSIDARPVGRYDGIGAGQRGIEPASIEPGSIVTDPYPQHMPEVLQAYQNELEHLGVSASIARGWINATASFGAKLGDAAHGLSWSEQLQNTVARSMRISGPIRTQPGERHVVALVGPTGVGKTTTIAKLAAGFRLESRRKVGLLTIDTYRIAAVQQLKAYAQIMDLPMEVVQKPDDIRSAMDKLGDVDLVLIDTTGRSPRSDARIEQLAQFLGQAQPDETHLVLSATSSPQVIRTTLQGFAPVRPTAAILTKLDETPYTAGILAAMSDQHPSRNHSHRALPLSYTTNGQQVPDDIGIANSVDLVQRLLPTAVQASGMEAAA